jgi:uracil DNA glycosylase
MGICFSVPKSVKTPPSLKNMYKVLSTDPAIKNFKVNKK